eukprot:TRINITY_DN6454_c0_g1_i1.p1 TRINITY_DN6454_c0_g1~~TRINITY_DN6454_c0_g1_i1.p1  ORF type:complete len:270 (+),score=82.36 TRINITY_DN6454_c0_g1_i1:78-887(+)
MSSHPPRAQDATPDPDHALAKPSANPRSQLESLLKSKSEAKSLEEKIRIQKLIDSLDIPVSEEKDCDKWGSNNWNKSRSVDHLSYVSKQSNKCAASADNVAYDPMIKRCIDHFKRKSKRDRQNRNDMSNPSTVSLSSGSKDGTNEDDISDASDNQHLAVPKECKEERKMRKKMEYHREKLDAIQMKIAMRKERLAQLDETIAIKKQILANLDDKITNRKEIVGQEEAFGRKRSNTLKQKVIGVMESAHVDRLWRNASGKNSDQLNPHIS